MYSKHSLSQNLKKKRKAKAPYTSQRHSSSSSDFEVLKSLNSFVWGTYWNWSNYSSKYLVFGWTIPWNCEIQTNISSKET